jgi:hypothetical protein
MAAVLKGYVCRAERELLPEGKFEVFGVIAPRISLHE